MKKILYLFLVLILIPSISLASFDVNLKYGSKGISVLELQNFLKDQDLLTTTLNGYFGRATKEAVKVFQRNNNIYPVSGIFGPLTRIQVNKLTTKLPSVILSVPVIPIFDVCKNIEGNQSIAPNDMYADNGSCFTSVKQNNQSAVVIPVDTYILEAKVVSGTGRDKDGKLEFSKENILHAYRGSNGSTTVKGSIAVDVLRNGIPVDFKKEQKDYVLYGSSTIPGQTQYTIVISETISVSEVFIENGVQKSYTYNQVTGLPNGTDIYTAPIGDYLLNFSIPALNITATVPVIVESSTN